MGSLGSTYSLNPAHRGGRGPERLGAPRPARGRAEEGGMAATPTTNDREADPGRPGPTGRSNAMYSVLETISGIQ